MVRPRETKFPYCPNILIDKGQAQEVADHWRDNGYAVRVVPRCVRALGTATQVYVVVVVKDKLMKT